MPAITPVALIESVCAVNTVPADFVRAIVSVESAGKSWAWNPEPRYHYLWNVKTNQPFRALTPAEIASEVPPADFPCLAGDRDQEWWGQAASWGPMQVMGAVAREYGFTGDYLTELCDPATGLHYGCRVIAGLIKWADGDLGKAAAGYNAGRGGWRNGLPYSTKVLRALDTIRRSGK